MTSHLIDATQMYLRTVWELEEEGIPPLRARLVERLNVTAPAVSETVSRLVAEGMLEIDDDRTLRLTDEGRSVAVSVMRKHRLAERLLSEVIGLEWERLHEEACRWEHVISDRVEDKLIELLGSPASCPHGNPIPGVPGGGDVEPLASLADAPGETTIRVERISEQLQGDVEAMTLLAQHGVRPGTVAKVAHPPGSVRVTTDEGGTLLLPEQMARLVYVTPE